MFAFKPLIVLALAGVSAFAAPLDARADCPAPGPLGERISCRYIVKPSPALPADYNRDAYKVEINQVLGGQVARESPSHDVQSDYTLWFTQNDGSWWVIGGVSTSGLTAKDLEKLVLGWRGKDFAGSLTPTWRIVDVGDCYYASNPANTVVRRWDGEKLV
ncbi:hypothetical protein PQX77_018957 [Marasmius sp. AFHP31]|nr:hypothetical protein PQX77_018957 [Marasmius sp. AFHP31]